MMIRDGAVTFCRQGFCDITRDSCDADALLVTPLLIEERRLAV